MNLFYVNPKDMQGSNIVVGGQEAIHISKVLRYSVGEVVLVTDGLGTGYRCEIVDIKKREVFLEIKSTEQRQVEGPVITLCMGIITKRDRLEFAIEKAVELGVSKIILFEGEHSQKGSVREDRLKSTTIAAMKQSLRFFLPPVYIEDSIEDAISNHAQDQCLIVADETLDELKTVPEGSQDCFVVVGPEGGFSENERNFLKRRDSIFYSIGPYRLRTETAAVVMVDRCSHFK